MSYLHSKLVTQHVTEGLLMHVKPVLGYRQSGKSGQCTFLFACSMVACFDLEIVFLSNSASASNSVCCLLELRSWLQIVMCVFPAHVEHVHKHLWLL